MSMTGRFQRAVIALTLAFLPLATALALDKGEYRTLPARQPVEAPEGKIEVREFFWYGCPHCYALEPRIDAWLEHAPGNVAFVRTPATGGRWLVHAQAYYAFEALGVTERLHGAMFRAIHEQNRRLDSLSALADFAAEQGIDPQRFRDAFNSFGVRTALERAKQINAAYQVTSVPLFAVDGKYVTSAYQTRGEQRLFGAIEELVELAARSRTRGGS
jgi:thiol:disulfide interchange protein DsbA